jgi:hypothetical protein
MRSLEMKMFLHVPPCKEFLLYSFAIRFLNILVIFMNKYKYLSKLNQNIALVFRSVNIMIYFSALDKSINMSMYLMYNFYKRTIYNMENTNTQ